MEVGEQNTSNHLQESTTTTTTTVSNEKPLQNDNTNNDNEFAKEVSELNTQEEQLEEPSVILPNLDDLKPPVTTAVAVVETAEEKEVTVQLEDSKSVECSNSIAVENDGDEVAVKDEITTTVECEAVVIVRNDDTNGSLVVEDDQDTVKMEEDAPLLPVAEIGEPEEIMTDVNDQIVHGDETVMDGQDDVEEGVDAKLVNDEKLVDTHTDEETAMSDEEKVGTESPETPVKGRGRPLKGMKRKRGGKNAKATPKPSAAGGKKTIEEEDVCFICFDGGDLVLCDKRDCPKAYHPSCVNRDPAFFQTKGKWNCGWHLCSVCVKKAEYMCYTCTFSLCKTCIKTNVLLCVREKEKKGFCEACMKVVMSFEKKSQENQENEDSDDKNSWEYLFKEYWTDTKAKLNLSLADLVEAKNAWKRAEPAEKQELQAGHSDGGSGSEHPSENVESLPKKTRKRKSKKFKTHDSATIASEGTSVPKNTEWASKELLEFVMHMGNDTSYQSQFDVQALLLEYIKTNKLRDTRRKSQIICDARLQRLFGKPRVGHFEMLKLLESHFLIKVDDDIQGSVVDTEVSLVDDDDSNETVPRVGKDKKRKLRKKNDREPQSNREDFAAIDTHNINLIYLKRKLVEDLLDDIESFHSKVVGTFVRTRISGANNKQEMHRLVQVKGITKGEPYAVGKKMTDTMLEILNLDKMESIPIDIISDQDFTEDECKRLRQSIKCGLINRPTVGDILDKTIELQAAKVNDSLEKEVIRLSHLRDRASDLGRKKELRECVEKLQVLKKPEERARRLQDIPVVHDDPTMDPKYESEDDAGEEENKQDTYKSSISSRFSKRRDYPSNESWRSTVTDSSRNPGKNYEFSRNLSSNSLSNKTEDATSPHIESYNEILRDQGRDRTVQPPTVLKKPNSANDAASTKDASETGPKVNEAEKMWHYKDPSGKIQGPFSMAQLRKWNNNKFFPVDLRIWRKSEKEDDGILLTDALEGKFHLKIMKLSLDILPSPTPNLSLGNVGPPVGPAVQSGHVVSPLANNMPLQMVQNPHGWGGGPVHNPQPSPVSGQQLVAYNHWGSAPNTGPVGPTPGNQNLNWGNVNTSWGSQAGPVNVHPGWVPTQPGQGVTPNQGWVTGSGPSQGNPNWVGPPSNPGEVASGWVGTPMPPRNRDRWDESEKHGPYDRRGFSGDRGNRGGGSGFRGNGRHWENRGSFKRS